MSSHALARDALMPRAQPGTGRGIGLSVLVHAGLIVAIAFGVNWRSSPPVAQQAELWAAVPQAAAPRAVEPEPAVVAPQPAPPPPAARPAPKVETPPPAPVPVPDAQIAIEKARAEKLRKDKAEAERELEAQRKKQVADKLAADKARQQQLLKDKQKDAEAQKLAQDKKDQAAEERLAQQREADRKKNIERMLGQAGASGEAGARGSAQQSAGPSAGYAGRIIAHLLPKIIFGDLVAGNPKAEVEVRVGPDGSILGRRLVKSSGVPAWDEAVLRAIDKAGSLPRDTDGRVQNPTLIVWGPKD